MWGSRGVKAWKLGRLEKHSACASAKSLGTGSVLRHLDRGTS